MQMHQIKLCTKIKAPIERVFDLSLSIDLHADANTNSNEVAIAGVTSGCIKLGETVTWKATHFGIRQRLRVQITALERPFSFVDEMLSGPFKKMQHSHYFSQEGAYSVMTDEFCFASPGGKLGYVISKKWLVNYMRRFLINKNTFLAKIAEGPGYINYLTPKETKCKDTTVSLRLK